jgi:hypothetical protein
VRFRGAEWSVVVSPDDISFEFQVQGTSTMHISGKWQRKPLPVVERCEPREIGLKHQVRAVCDLSRKAAIERKAATTAR